MDQSAQAPQFSHFDLAHWARVRAARKERGLPHRGADEGPIPHHPLVGRRLTDINGVEHEVQSVVREWCQAYGMSLLLKTDSGSHSRVYVRGTSHWQSDQIAQFVARFPSVAPEVIAQT